MEPPQLPKPKRPKETPATAEAEPEAVLDPLDHPDLPQALKSLKERLDKEKKYRRNTTYALSLAVFVVFFLIAGIFVQQRQRAHDNHLTDQKQEATVAGICGVTNVNRIGIQNMLADINAMKPFALTANWQAFFQKHHALFTPIDCRAVISPEVGVQLCLLYPPQNDPNTGKPVPTTIDPLNEKNCPSSAPPKDKSTTTGALK